MAQAVSRAAAASDPEATPHGFRADMREDAAECKEDIVRGSNGDRGRDLPHLPGRHAAGRERCGTPPARAPRRGRQAARQATHVTLRRALHVAVSPVREPADRECRTLDGGGWSTQGRVLPDADAPATSCLAQHAAGTSAEAESRETGRRKDLSAERNLVAVELRRGPSLPARRSAAGRSTREQRLARRNHAARHTSGRRPRRHPGGRTSRAVGSHPGSGITSQSTKRRRSPLAPRPSSSTRSTRGPRRRGFRGRRPDGVTHAGSPLPFLRRARSTGNNVTSSGLGAEAVEECRRLGRQRRGVVSRATICLPLAPAGVEQEPRLAGFRSDACSPIR